MTNSLAGLRRVMAGVLLCMIATLASAGGTGAEVSISVELSLAKASVKPCEKLEFDVTVTNVSDESEVVLPAALDDPYYWLRIELVAPSGKTVSYEGPEYQIVGLEETVTLFPGHYFGKRMALTCESYDIRQSGTYKISVIYGHGPTKRRSLPHVVRSDVHTFKVAN